MCAPPLPQLQHLLLPLLLVIITHTTEAHPQCSPRTQASFLPPTSGSGGRFCSQYDNAEGTCCSFSEDNALRNTFEEQVEVLSLDIECQELYREFLCIPCDPWSSHIYQTAPDSVSYASLTTEGANVKQSFGAAYLSGCPASLTGGQSFLSLYTQEPDYPQSFPLTAADKSFGVPSSSSGLTPTYPGLEGGIPGPITGAYMPPGSNQWWVLVQTGSIVSVDNTASVNAVTEIMADSGAVQGGSAPGDERGLLGLAFAPDFEVSGCFFLYFTAQEGNVVERFFYSGSTVSFASGERVATLPNPAANHNGGWIGFSPIDAQVGGFYTLFVSSGDGGGANDPQGYAQNADSFLGKMLTATVSSLPGSSAAASLVVHARGLRNPWRCSFDREDGRLFCGDVGQNRVEEIVEIRRGDNHGWNTYEGSCTGGSCSGVVNPLFEYCHPGTSMVTCDGGFSGFSVTGGYVYRGFKYPNFQGDYFFGDYIQRGIAQIGSTSGALVETWTFDEARMSAFAEDNSGELYIINHSASPHVFYNLPCDGGGGDCPTEPDNTPQWTPRPVAAPTAPPTPQPSPLPLPRVTSPPTLQPSVQPAPPDVPPNVSLGDCEDVGSCGRGYTCEVFPACAQGGLGCIHETLCRYCGDHPILPDCVTPADNEVVTPPSRPTVFSPCVGVGGCGQNGQTCEAHAPCAQGGLGCIHDTTCRYCSFGPFRTCASSSSSSNNSVQTQQSSEGSSSLCDGRMSCGKGSPPQQCEVDEACANGGRWCLPQEDGSTLLCRYCGSAFQPPCHS